MAGYMWVALAAEATRAGIIEIAAHIIAMGGINTATKQK
jgi:alkylhydroperoxidase/carboxymuconolactone decarboxylase family protein YurZ